MGGFFWLASYPKSGNTWVRAFLSNFIAGLQGRDISQGVDFNFVYSFTASEAHTRFHSNFHGKELTSGDDKMIAQYRRDVQEKIANSTDSLLFMKTHSYLGEAYGHPIFNEKYMRGALYIVRNPLDVALSWSHHLNVSIDKTIDIMNNPNAQTPTYEKLVFEKTTDWSNHVFSWTKQELPNFLMCMRYEDMLENPLKSFSSLVRFLQLKAPKKILRQAVDNVSFRKLQQKEQVQGFSERPEYVKNFFRKGIKGQWETELSKKQIDKIVEVHNVQMKRFGYLP